MATIEERRRKQAEARKKKGRRPRKPDMGDPPKDAIIPDPTRQARRKKKGSRRRA